MSPPPRFLAALGALLALSFVRAMIVIASAFFGVAMLRAAVAAFTEREWFDAGLLLVVASASLVVSFRWFALRGNRNQRNGRNGPEV